MGAARLKYEEALTVRRDAYGSESAEVADTNMRIAAVYKRQDLLQEAKHKLEEALGVRQRVLGTDHADVGATYRELGLIECRRDNWHEAAEMLEHAHIIYAESLGKAHKLTISTVLMRAAAMNNIAVSLQERGKDQQALDKYGVALELQQSDAGSASAARLAAARTLTNMAHVIGRARHGSREDECGRLEDALGKYTEALGIYRSAYGGDDHKDVSAVLHDMAHVLHRLDRLEEALSKYDLALRIEIDTLGEQDENVGMTYGNMAYVHSDRGNYEEAKKCAKKAHSIFIRQCGRNHSFTEKAKSQYEDAKEGLAQDDPDAAARRQFSSDNGLGSNAPAEQAQDTQSRAAYKSAPS